MQEDIFPFKHGRKGSQCHAKGKKHAISLKVSEGIGCVSDFFEKTSTN